MSTLELTEVAGEGRSGEWELWMHIEYCLENPQRGPSGAQLSLGPKTQKSFRWGAHATLTQDLDLRPLCGHFCDNFDRHFFLYAWGFGGRHLFLTVGMLLLHLKLWGRALESVY